MELLRGLPHRESGLQNTFVAIAVISIGVAATFFPMVKYGKSFRRRCAKKYWRYVESCVWVIDLMFLRMDSFVVDFTRQTVNFALLQWRIYEQEIKETPPYFAPQSFNSKFLGRSFPCFN
jgi:hypothetical protein